MKATILLLASSVIGANAAITMTKDSSAFTNTYNGSEIYDGASYVNGWSGAGGTVNPSTTGTTLTVTTPGTNGWVQQDNGSSDWETAIGAGSWTMETQLTLGAGDGLALWLDPSATLSVGTIIYVGANGIGNLGNGSESNQSFSSDSNLGTNTFRVAYDSVDSMISLWRNGSLVTSTIAPSNPGGAGTTRLIIGDCCSNASTGVTTDGFDIEYVRYDTSGAFAPIPEPSVFALFGLGGLGLILRRRK